jgi:aspartokinase
MEVKVFVHQSAIEAEKEVNNWMAENNISVQYIGQSQSEKSGKFVFVISVFYIRTQSFMQLQQV